MNHSVSYARSTLPTPVGCIGSRPPVRETIGTARRPYTLST